MTDLVETSPLTGEVVGSYACATEDEVAAAVARAREVFHASWGSTTPTERVAYLRRLKGLLVDEMDEIAQAICRATGKIHLEALAAEVMTCIDICHWAIGHVEQALAPEGRPSPVLVGRGNYTVEHSPIGVVAVFSPWNYPLQLALVPMLTALAAGNCVVLKPSEVTPSIGVLIGELCSRAGLPDGVVQVALGGPDVGQALVAARPDKIFFTGSVATGKKVMAAAAQHLVPVTLELGGKDPMIVFEDATLDRAVAAAVYGAFTNAGQTCVAIERVYVEQSIYDRFVDAVTAATVELRVGPDGEIGPIINPAQRTIIDAHVDDALARGARLTTDRRRDGSLYHPIVLRDVDHSMLVMTEETFGPVLPMMPFPTESEAVDLANDSVYGLNASVWTENIERGKRVAASLVTGNVAINDVMINIANPHMPFGGEKHSGMGRYHGPEGLRAFSRQKSVMVCESRRAREVNWFPYTATGLKGLRAMIRALYDDKPVLTKARAILSDLLGLRESGGR